MTARDLINGALRLIGAIASGETLSGNELSDALLVLNDMMDSWSADGFMINEVKRESFPLIPSQQTYTIGIGGNFNTSRPTLIQEVTLDQNGVEIPVKIINLQEWAAITVKNVTSSIPQKMYIEGAFPLERFNIWPIPSVANNLVIYTLNPLSSFASANTVVQLPPGYSKAIRYNLAMELAPEYGKEPTPFIISTAAETKADVKRTNTDPVYMTSDVAGLTTNKSFNYLTGV